MSRSDTLKYLEVPDPRKLAAIRAYTDPKSSTYGNAKQSALAAGYSESYAKNFTIETQNWFKDTIDKMGLVKTAKRVLKDSLEFEDQENPVAAARIRLDAAKFVAGSDEEFSAKTEQRVEHEVTQDAFEKIGELIEEYR